MPDSRGRVLCRARANGEVRRLTPSEVAASVPHIYEIAEEDEARAAVEPTRAPALLTPERPLDTRTRRKRR